MKQNENDLVDILKVILEQRYNQNKLVHWTNGESFDDYYNRLIKIEEAVIKAIQDV